MEKEFAPYEQALDLKELGFNEPCFRYYWENGGSMGEHSTPKNNSDLIYDSTHNLKGLQGTKFCTLPLYQQAFRFFREKYNELHTVNIDLSDNLKDKVYVFTIEDHLGSIVDRSEEYGTYEEAELSCLLKLIEIVKDDENKKKN